MNFKKPNYFLSTCARRSRGSFPKVFYKNGIHKDFAKFTGKHLCWSLFFDKVSGLQPATLLKRDSKAGVFLWIL